MTGADDLMTDWDEDQPLSGWITDNDRDDTPGRHLTAVVRRLESLIDDEYPLIWNVSPWALGHRSHGPQTRIHRIECEAGVLVLREHREWYEKIYRRGCGGYRTVSHGAGFSAPGFTSRELQRIWQR